MTQLASPANSHTKRSAQAMLAHHSAVAINVERKQKSFN
jgi:hypothetical protein